MRTDESRRLYGGLKEGFQTVLATFYGIHDRHADAEKLFTEALACQQIELGSYHVETMCTMNELGALYLEIGKVANAEDMLNQTLRVKEISLGPDHPRTLNTVNNIGNLYSLQLQFDKAAEMYQRTLQGYTKIHGPRHKAVAEAWNNLGEVSMKQGNFATAGQQFKTALEKAPTLKDSDSVFVLYVKSNLALAYKLERRYDIATELYSQIIVGRTLMLGPNHSSTLQSICELGDVHLSAGELDQAENCYVNGKASAERRKNAQLELKAREDVSETHAEPAQDESNPKQQNTTISIDHLDSDDMKCEYIKRGGICMHNINHARWNANY
jgi:tetratricopeptide (TPR) repeat protein